jgi:hypothetical protein
MMRRSASRPGPDAGNAVSGAARLPPIPWSCSCYPEAGLCASVPSSRRVAVHAAVRGHAPGAPASEWLPPTDPAPGVIPPAFSKHPFISPNLPELSEPDNRGTTAKEGTASVVVLLRKIRLFIPQSQLKCTGTFPSLSILLHANFTYLTCFRTLPVSLPVKEKRYTQRNYCQSDSGCARRRHQSLIQQQNGNPDERQRYPGITPGSIGAH